MRRALKQVDVNKQQLVVQPLHLQHSNQTSMSHCTKSILTLLVDVSLGGRGVNTKTTRHIASCAKSTHQNTSYHWLSDMSGSNHADLTAPLALAVVLRKIACSWTAHITEQHGCDDFAPSALYQAAIDQPHMLAAPTSISLIISTAGGWLSSTPLSANG